MAVDRGSGIHRNRRGDAADSGIPGVFGCLLLFLKRADENQVHGRPLNARRAARRGGQNIAPALVRGIAGGWADEQRA